MLLIIILSLKLLSVNLACINTNKYCSYFILDIYRGLSITYILYIKYYLNICNNNNLLTDTSIYNPHFIHLTSW